LAATYSSNEARICILSKNHVKQAFFHPDLICACH